MRYGDIVQWMKARRWMCGEKVPVPWSWVLYYIWCLTATKILWMYTHTYSRHTRSYPAKIYTKHERETDMWKGNWIFCRYNTHLFLPCGTLPIEEHVQCTCTYKSYICISHTALTSYILYIVTCAPMCCNTSSLHIFRCIRSHMWVCSLHCMYICTIPRTIQCTCS